MSVAANVESKKMKKIAILASDNMMPDTKEQRADFFERDEQMGKLIPAFKARDMALELLPWRGCAQKASAYEAILPLFVWDYFEGNEAEFMSEMAKLAGQTLLLNPLETLAWNAKKTYLEDLKAKGAPVIDTLLLDRVTQNNVMRALGMFETKSLVIKPQIGGGAWRQVLWHEGETFPDEDSLPPKGALVQPFLPSVLEEGEYSFLYFGGQFSHGLIKRPKQGDYRIQSIYGGREVAYTPTQEDLKTARDILDSLDFIPLYARIDLLRGRDGELKLIELEMIEPYLYLAFAQGEGADNKGAQKLAAALAKQLT